MGGGLYSDFTTLVNTFVNKSVCAQVVWALRRRRYNTDSILVDSFWNGSVKTQWVAADVAAAVPIDHSVFTPLLHLCVQVSIVSVTNCLEV